MNELLKLIFFKFFPKWFFIWGDIIDFTRSRNAILIEEIPYLYFRQDIVEPILPFVDVPVGSTKLNTNNEQKSVRLTSLAKAVVEKVFSPFYWYRSHLT